MSAGCFVPHCNNTPGQKNSRGELISFFKPHSDESKEWLRLIGRVDCLSQENLNFEICDDHFLEDDINKEFEVAIDGEVATFPREKKTLKPGAKPCFFPLQLQGESTVENPDALDRAITPVSVKSEHIEDDDPVDESPRLCSETDTASEGRPLDLFSTLDLLSFDKTPTVRLQKMEKSMLAQYPVQRVSMLERAMARKTKMDDLGNSVGRRKRKIDPQKTSGKPMKRKKTEKMPEKVKQRPKPPAKKATARRVKINELRKGKKDKDVKKSKGGKSELGKSSKRVKKITVELKKSSKVLKSRGRRAQDPRLTIRAGKATMKRTGTLKAPAAKKVQPKVKKTDKPVKKNADESKVKKGKTLPVDEEEKKDSGKKTGATPKPRKKAAPINSLMKKKSASKGPGPGNVRVRKKKEPGPPKLRWNRKILRMSSSEDEDDDLPVYALSHAVPSTSQNVTAYPQVSNPSGSKPLIVPKPRPLILAKSRTPFGSPELSKQPLFVKKESSPFIVPKPGQHVLIDLTGPASQTNQMPSNLLQAVGAKPAVGSPITPGSAQMVLNCSGAPQTPASGREIKLTKVNQVPAAVMKQIEELIKKKKIPSPKAPTKDQNGVGPCGTKSGNGVSASSDISIDVSNMSIADVLSNLSPAGIKIVDVQQTSAKTSNLSSSNASAPKSNSTSGLVDSMNVCSPPSPDRDYGDDGSSSDVLNNVPTVIDTTLGRDSVPSTVGRSSLPLTAATVGNTVPSRVILGNKPVPKVVSAADLFSSFTPSSKMKGDMFVKVTVGKPANQSGNTTQRPTNSTTNTSVICSVNSLPAASPSSESKLNFSVSAGQVGSWQPPDGLNEMVTTRASQKYSIHKDATTVTLPGSMWGLHQNDKMTVFLQIDDTINVKKCVIFEKDNPPKVYCGTHEVQDFNINYDSKEDVQRILAQIHRWKLCIGTKSVAFWSFAEGCKRYFTSGSDDRRCEPCRRAHLKKLKKKMERLY